jgi:TetR/AcrR family transcriptional repressor of bet genes
MNESRGVPRVEATTRILDAALEELVAHGADSLAMHAVAERAGVSKGLIHYHFHDRNALLADVAPRLAARIAARARKALVASTTTTVIADLERWLERELELGEWRGLLALAEWPAADVQHAAAAALASRREEVRRVLEQLFALLEIRTKISLAPLTDLAVAVVNGLAAERSSGRDASPALDALVMAFYRLSD